MKISKTVLGLVITGVLLAGWQKVSKAEEGTEAVKEAPSAEVIAPVISAPAVIESTAPAAVPAAEVTPAAEAPAVTTPSTGAAANISIADLYAKKAEFNGKNVTVFGKVVKVSKGIMGKNWLHIQDGTGVQGTNDLTITTAGIANPNDKVSVSGIVTLDKDFGAGYKYEVIIEDAAVTAR